MRWWALGLMGALTACDSGDGSTSPQPSVDAGRDRGVDAVPVDQGRPDATLRDARLADRGPADAEPADARVDAGITDDWDVLVLLDGQPAGGIRVMQGGTQTFVLTAADGTARIHLDRTLPGDPVIIASHPQARTRGFIAYVDEQPPAVIELATFNDADNPAYLFQDPGEPRRRDTTGQCGHCHLTLNDGWFASPHRTAASNPNVQDLYRGTARFPTAEACAAGGGRWVMGELPGGERGSQCVVGLNVVDQVAEGTFGACASCHAPGLDGRLGGRDLAEATGRAFTYGVHCDVCHRVEAVDLQAAGPGVAGKLHLVRPTETAPISLGAGGLLPLTFGPSYDSPNPRMGSVQRDHYRNGQICAGCHQYEAPALGRGQRVDANRWPSGRLPIQTTWAEWQGSVLSAATACNDCHMPPDPLVANGADLQAFPLADVGIQGGFVRPAGAVRQHTWPGPRQPGGALVGLAASLMVEKSIVDGELVARVTLRNQGAGHGLPTGEPMRAVLVTVEARCGAEVLPPSGGDALPAWAGAYARKARGEDWSVWPGAEVGQAIRVTRRTGNFHDYMGFGPFGDGAFSPAAKGLPEEEILGDATITAVDPEGVVTLDRPLPEGEFADLGDGVWQAGAPGFAYARVMVDAGGREMVPHYQATDVRSDNRLLPQQRWTSTHRFRTRCPEPEVTARAIHRPFPLWLVAERGWSVGDQVIAEVRR